MIVYTVSFFGTVEIYLRSLQALLSGCSAGGLATLIHCDDFQELLPKVATVKCLADAGFFLDEYVFVHILQLSSPIFLTNCCPGHCMLPFQNPLRSCCFLIKSLLGMIFIHVSGSCLF